MGTGAGRARVTDEEAWAQGILLARPAAAEPWGVGTSPLGIGAGRDGLVLVPAGLVPDRPAPLLIMLHGAGGVASHALGLVAAEAGRRGVLVLAPDSRGRTWDVIEGGYGPDPAFIDDALGRVLAAHPVDRGRIAVGGFSDGASYALCLGLINGGLVSDILAFSPGFAAPTRTDGTPRVFISHGRADGVLPIDRCGRRVAGTLRRAGYDLDYREFDGGHVVPPDMVAAAFDRFGDREGRP